MLKDGQVWLNRSKVAKIEKNGCPGWKCVLFRKKTRNNLSFLDVVEGDDQKIIDELNGNKMKLTDKSIVFA